MATPAMAARPMTVEQLEELLARLSTKPDGKVAQELADVEMTQRVSSVRLARWETEFTGPRAREALMKLADTAAFLKAPPGDAVPDPAPDAETQQRMLWLAVEYVRTTITRLPNFYANRETTHFENPPSQRAEFAAGSSFAGGAANAARTPEVTVPAAEYKTLHEVGVTTATVTYRDGREVSDADAGTGKKENRPAIGLTTTGEFGPILLVVMGDAMRGTVEWVRWEQGDSEPAAVFRYSVPESRSHFKVEIPNGEKLETLYPAYHGEIAIDPAAGAIVWLSEVTDLAPPYDTMQAAIRVEYAPVEIGDRSYICPVRGVALSRTPIASAATTTQSWSAPMQTQLNDVAFTHYHVFRAEARMVTDGSGQGDAAPADGAAPAGGPQH
jgi:hypothetical protein